MKQLLTKFFKDKTYRIINVSMIQNSFYFTVNKSRKSFVGKIWEAESAVSGDEGPQKSWGNKIRVRVRALTVMDLESHVLTGLPHT